MNDREKLVQDMLAIVKHFQNIGKDSKHIDVLMDEVRKQFEGEEVQAELIEHQIKIITHMAEMINLLMDYSNTVEKQVVAYDQMTAINMRFMLN